MTQSQTKPALEPLAPPNEDSESLQDLGRACAAIVHDARNELNALKLYATFLLRRSQKNNWLPDEQDTLAKVFVALERSTSSLAMLERYSRPVETARRSGIDLKQIVVSLSLDSDLRKMFTEALEKSLSVDSGSGSFTGNFDPPLLREALAAITLDALNLRNRGAHSAPLEIRLRRETLETGTAAVVDWIGSGYNTEELLSATGIGGVRVALANRMLAAQAGTIEKHSGSIRVRLPLSQ
jgi:hypothetical protein